VAVFGLEVPLPVVVLGAITGMTYGLLAVGLILVHRTNRIINFAHGEVGAFAAAVMGLAVVEFGLPYWVALPVGLAVGAGVGATSEVVVVRRLRNAPILMSLVATLGLAQFLVMLSVTVNSGVTAGRSFPQPTFLPEFELGALLVTPAYFAMLVGTPLVVLALAWFLNRSRFGLALRAAASNTDAARLAGVPASRTSTTAWAIAGALAAFTAILVLPTRGFSNAQFLGPGLLLRALAAAVIARLMSLPVALAAGVAVGVVEQLALWNSPRGGIIDAVLFTVVLAALLLQRRQQSRGRDRTDWAAVEPWRPLTAALKQVPAIRNLGWAVAGLTIVGAALVPILATNATSTTMVAILSFALVGISVGIVTGLAGQLSLGQFAFAGVGAAISYLVAFNTGNYALSLLAAGGTAALASVVIGLPALRIKGLLLAVTTLAFALATQGWLLGQPWLLGDGVNPGRPIVAGVPLDTGKRYYVFALVITLVGVWLARNVWAGGIGRRLKAVRDNEDAARAFALSATRIKLQGFAVAGFLAGVGGAVYGHSLSQITADVFPIGASIDATALTVLGGVGVLAGPVLGALYIIGVPAFVPLDSAGLAATSFGWLLLILYYPGGIAQALRPARDWIVDALARRAGVSADAPEPTTVPAIELSSFAPAERERAGPLLTVEHLGKSYGGVRAVHDVSLAIASGETVGLMGPNGAGKTTLFELIGGFTPSDSGSVQFDGEDVTRWPAERRARVGLIRSFQDAALFPTLTVSETVELSLERNRPTRFVPSVLGVHRTERQRAEEARELVAFMGLDHYRDTPIRELSTGTRRITELACLLALRPKLLLLDEPAAGIAQRETEALGDLLRRLQGELHLTLLIIEHDVPLLMQLSDRIVAMHASRVIADGDPETVRMNPVVVESYLGGDPTAIARSGAVADQVAESPRCVASTATGRRCSRTATTERHCLQHARQLEAVG
jgi:ABC-type branched-subunit amino acid transport system ATPase component/ABC-type branched-subunit amino acid transport system permease subunit